MASALARGSASAVPVSRATPYQASVSNPSCVGATTYLFTFPKVTGTGHAVLSHVSCRIVVNGVSGNVAIPFAVLGSTAQNTSTDFLASSLEVSNSLTVGMINGTTLYFVPAGSSPQVTVSTVSIPTTVLTAIMHNVMGFHTCVEQTRANSDQLIGVM
jgi:hypothetical protein